MRNTLILSFLLFFINVAISQTLSEVKHKEKVNELVVSYLNFVNNTSNKTAFLKNKNVFARKPFRDETNEPYFNLNNLRQLYKKTYSDGYEVKFYNKKIIVGDILIDQKLNTYYTEVKIPQILVYNEIKETYKDTTIRDSILVDTLYSYTERVDSILQIDTLKRSKKSMLKLYITYNNKFNEYRDHAIEAVTFNKFKYKHQPISELSTYWVNLEESWRDVIRKKLNFPELATDYYLKRIYGIRELDLSKSEITNFEPLTEFKGLTYLNVNNRPLDTLIYVKNCTKLTRLDIQNCNLTSLHGLEDLVNLESLSAAKNEIEDLTPLKALTRISYLNLNENKIMDLTPLKGMTYMNKLHLNLNVIESLEPLRSMVILSELFVRKNKEISSLEPIRKCQTLVKLDCFNTKVPSLDPIKNHIRMVHLDCSHTKITSLAPIRNMSNLIHLSFEANKLSDFSILNRLDRLKYLNCSQTNISDISSISRMEYIKELRAIHTDFSKQDIQRFKKKHPRVAITYY